jgi:hypothetical protein
VTQHALTCRHAFAHACFASAAVPAAPAPPGTPAAATNAAAEAVARLRAQVLAAKARAVSVAQIDAVRSLADWLAFGSAFILTGNLFAPFLGSVVTDGAFSAYQRLGAVRLAKRESGKWEAATAMLRAKADAKEAEQSAKAAAEEPPQEPPQQ